MPSEKLPAAQVEPEPSDSMGDAEFRQLSIDVLDGAHRDIFTRAITRILDTEIAEITYAQIIDGLPLALVAYDSRGGGPYRGHPIYNVHKELCSGIVDKTREFRRNFDARILKFDSRLLFAYRSAAPGSRVFNIRLIEMIAISVHQIAVALFQLDESCHQDDGISQWAPPKSEELYWYRHPNGPPPTLFIHPFYLDHDQYPDGTGNMVGYWAEARILGGVVLFDRRRVDPDPDAVYFHPDRKDETYRIFELLPEQKQSLLNFLTADSPVSPSPLPILADDNNRNRVDPEERIEDTGIFRNTWDRKEHPVTYADRRFRDVWDTMDFPTHEDKYEAGLRARDAKNRHDYGDDWEEMLKKYYD
ncbi:hypothetical protein NM208_g3122 [Fusarium decemcellulare]|uniref:Uncharacterized protein n=1 Tax=Fusarium decemcellulare TaxID=57161 RepID=A0ACC1SQH9_9HYPO|nr:hypothetical protein NM208_g3122 [Fusarium decemcellulare]